MKRTKRLLAFLLCFVLLLPLVTSYGFAAEEEALTIDNGYIQVSVSTKNGGFLVNTVEGNLLRKSDNNKKLLYRSGEYDTSFVSFRVGSGENARDYLFGGKYAGASEVSVTKTAGGELVAVWSADGITFTQTITLAGDNADEHGMISIGLSAKNGSGAAVPVQARILLDTCLGDQDWAHYQFTDGSLTHTLDTEQVVTDVAALKSFYALDDLANPAITAYVVSTPSKAAIGHWNNLAATLFDFTPDTAMNFTNYINDYLTADSACALYYDLGTVAAGATQSVAAFYGVYSNHTVKRQNSIAVNTVAPMRLNLNDQKTAYVRESSVGLADFAVTVSAENYKSETSGDLKNVILAVRSTGGLCSLGDSGQTISGIDFDTPDPLTIMYDTIREGDTVTKALYFRAKPQDSASYERITVGFYNGEVTGENLLGEKNVYVLLPASDGGIPQICFNSMTPDTIYNEGTRHLYLAVTNAPLLNDSLAAGNCVFKAYSEDGKKSWEIPSDSISVNEGEGVADIALTDELKLAVGSWKLQLEWSDAAVAGGIVAKEHQKQTAEKLKFTVSDDPKYRNDTYGVLAVVKYGKGTTQYPYYYRLLNFADETRYKAFAEEKDHDWAEILLVFRGAFTMDKRYTVKDENGTRGFYYSAVSKKTVDPKTRESTVTNRITVNNCVDFEGGTIAVYYEDYSNKNANSSILVEIDGELYTSDARTSVWTGKAALTKLEQGGNFSLVHYDGDGNRKSSSATPITLIWPNVFSLAQTLAGMAFKLAYGQFGVMEKDGKELGRVISFAASLSLSFLKSPAGDKTDYGTASYFGRMQELWKDYRGGVSLYQYAYNGRRLGELLDIGMNDKDKSNEKKQGVMTSVMIPDILFGCGKGFVGLNFTVDVTVQNMVDSLAKIEAALSVNTMGNWSVGMSGYCELVDDINMEAKLKFKSYNNIPIPDELYFYVGGFKPGLCIDPCGVVWITGAGGGFSGLYDTIFYTGGIPPLKLVMTMGFAALQILEGTAKMEVSGSGVSITASKLKIKDTIEVVKKIQVALQWYPDLKLSGAVYISMFEKCIEGQGYMIILGKDYTDWFFEMFIRAALKIPDSIPVVGGVTVAGVDLGVSTEKIWGALEALSVTVGVTYYWGEDSVDFGSGKKAHPTYPGLLLEGYDGEYEDFPVAYDEENGRTLYARFGTNFEAPVPAQILSDGDLILMDAAGVWSDMDRTSHKFDLGPYDAGTNSAAVVQLSYPAKSLEDAKALAESFTVTDAPKGAGSSLPLIVYNGGNLDTANANVTWNEETGIACFAFTVADSAMYDKPWFISTGETAADVVLYNVLPLPKINAVSADASVAAGSDARVNWTGTGLSELDSISFFLVSSDDPTTDAGYPIGSAVTESLDAGSAVLTVPGSVPAGEYLLRAVYSKDDQLNGIIHSTLRIKVENSNTPASVDTVSVSPAGDLKLGVTVSQTTDDNTTGYYVTIYDAEASEEDGSPRYVADMTFDKASSGDTSFEIGGSYVSPVRKDPDDPDSEVIGTEAFGLEGGKTYKIGVTPFKLLEGDTIVYGKETLSAAVVLPAAVTPGAVLTAEDQTLTALRDMADGAPIPVFAVNELSITAIFTEAVTGTWTLDNTDVWASMDGSDGTAVTGSFSSTESTVIDLTGLADGSHVLNITGCAEDGDRFAYSYPFTVDTAAPRLMIGSPLSGSFFSDEGTVVFTGVTDTDALLTITVDGKTIVDGKTVTAAGGALGMDGVFNLEVSIPDHNSAATHILTIFAADENGNRTETNTIQVTHPGLGDLADLVIMVNDAVPADGSISTVGGANDVQLTVLGVTSGGKTFALEQDRVFWDSFAAEGSASMDGDGVLNCTPYTYGFVEARVEVSNGACRTASLALAGDSKAGRVSISATVGGTATGGGDYQPGETVTLRAYADEGYRFVGWEITGVEVSDLTAETVSFRMPDGAVEVKASFRAEEELEPEYCTMTFDPNGGSAVEAQRVEKGKTAVKPADPAREGYTFDGWFLGDTLYDFSTPVTESITLKAKWTEETEEPEPEYCTVTFDPNGGSAVEAQRVEKGKTAVKPADPAREGYTFDGWFLGDTAFDFSTPITEDITIKAKWSKNTEPEPEPGPGPAPVPKPPKTDSSLLAYADVPEGTDPNRYVPYTLDADGNKKIIPISAVIDGRLAYLKPEGDQQIYFMENPVAFNDIGGHWAEANILWTAAHGLFNGVGDGAFDPGGTMTRAMFVTVLYRLAGSPAVMGQSGFSDVPQGAWYADAVTWAARLGIVQGMGDGTFVPNADVTREQMCVFVSRFLRSFGYELALGEKADFADAGQIASWATADVEYCQRAGIITGKPGGVFDPKANATRAENATVMKRIVEAILSSLK